MTDPDPRIEQLIAHDQIRLLASRYAVAVDSRDLDTLVALFVDDVQVGRSAFGRAALKSSFQDSLSSVGVTILQVTTHVIDLIDADHATGIVYCAGQVQDDEQWIHQSILYRDDYERRDGSWLFVRRTHELFHGVAAVVNPLGQEPANWPQRSFGRGTAPESFATWAEFWDPYAGESVADDSVGDDNSS
ncbi:nuclear transport factor 2 family protein [soil metagenome]